MPWLCSCGRLETAFFYSMHVKRVAGNIIPAIATTTAAVSALVSLELLKILRNASLEEYRNAFLNLALPLFQMSEPLPAPRTSVNDKLSFTAWDSFEVVGDRTVQELITFFQVRYVHYCSYERIREEWNVNKKDTCRFHQ